MELFKPSTFQRCKILRSALSTRENFREEKFEMGSQSKIAWVFYCILCVGIVVLFATEETMLLLKYNGSTNFLSKRSNREYYILDVYIICYLTGHRA